MQLKTLPLGDLGTTVVAKRNTLDIILLMYMKICETQSDQMEMGDPSPETHSSATKKEKEKEEEEEEEEKVKIKRENLRHSLHFLNCGHCSHLLATVCSERGGSLRHQETTPYST